MTLCRMPCGLAGDSELSMSSMKNHEALQIEIDTSLLATRVVCALNELVEVRGPPLSLRLDNSAKVDAQSLTDWAKTLSNVASAGQAHAEGLRGAIQRDLPHVRARLLRVR